MEIFCSSTATTQTCNTPYLSDRGPTVVEPRYMPAKSAIDMYVFSMGDIGHDWQDTMFASSGRIINSAPFPRSCNEQ